MIYRHTLDIVGLVPDHKKSRVDIFWLEGLVFNLNKNVSEVQ